MLCLGHIPNNHVITIISNTFTPLIKGATWATYKMLTGQHLGSNNLDVNVIRMHNLDFVMKTT